MQFTGDCERVYLELQEKRKKAQAYREETKKIALKVYELLISEGITIAQSKDALEAAIEMINEAEHKAKLC